MTLPCRGGNTQTEEYCCGTLLAEAGSLLALSRSKGTSTLGQKCARFKLYDVYRYILKDLILMGMMLYPDILRGRWRCSVYA